ncbi:MAG: type I pantothenate kinase [Acidimicrobiales bacterium]
MGDEIPSRHLDLTIEEWARLGEASTSPLGESDLAPLRGRLEERLDVAEVERAYRPLARLLGLRAVAARATNDAVAAFLGRPGSSVPFVVGIAGSVAVGKSTTARLLQALVARGPGSPRVDIVATDGFLFPNAELERRGLLARKGFPQSYDGRRLLRFLAEVKAGRAEAHVPVYSHTRYDIVPGQGQSVRRPEVLLVEGLNVLSTAARTPVVVSDFFDFTIYVDADEADIEAWYVERFLGLRATVFEDPASYFHRYAALDDKEAQDTARAIWQTVNAVNLRENILPTRERAHLILEKGPDHRVRRVRLRPW